MRNPLPNRIISLVPSKTELLYYLGLDQEVVGITKFCIHPAHWFNSKQRVGGTKRLHLSTIRELKPDLIIANKEENTKEEIEVLSQEFNVYLSDIKTISDALIMIKEIGERVGKEEAAGELIQTLSDWMKDEPIKHSRRALYLIWQKPYMAAGRDTFIHDMMRLAGFENVVQENRYPELTETQIAELNPDVILLSSEPFPFKDKHVEAFRELCPQAQVCLVDGEIFSWYGNRMLKAKDYFRQLNEYLEN